MCVHACMCGSGNSGRSGPEGGMYSNDIFTQYISRLVACILCHIDAYVG